MISHPTQEIKISTADPSAIGLFGLAMVTLVASSQKLGLTSGVSFVLPWAVFLGGFAQLFACIHDAKHNNTFGTTAFGAYALFWFALARHGSSRWAYSVTSSRQPRIPNNSALPSWVT
jgi:uncharacterized protein